MKTKHGNLITLALQGEFDVIIHGCNCFHCMGAGIAAQIRRYFPKAFEADCQTPYGDENKLGTISYSKVGDLTVVNAYTQFRPGPDFRLGSLRSCFRRIREEFFSARIGYPAIGAGIGGGDWNEISKVIDEELKGEDHTYIIFSND